MASLAKSFLKHTLIWMLVTHVLTALYLAYRHSWSVTEVCDTLFKASLILAVLGCLMVSGYERSSHHEHVVHAQAASSLMDAHEQRQMDRDKTLFVFLAMFTSAILIYLETRVLEKFF